MRPASSPGFGLTRVPLGPGDDEALANHFARLNAARDGWGLPLYSPFSDLPGATDADAAERKARLARPLTAPGWRRLWGARDGKGAIIAHLALSGPELDAELHRARVSLGVEPAYQRRGLGEGLLADAIAFAQGAGLAWLDLWVFGHNAAALALYRKAGFVEIGRYKDQFRVGQRSIDDLAMALALDRSGA